MLSRWEIKTRSGRDRPWAFGQNGVWERNRAILERPAGGDAVPQSENPNLFVNLARAVAGHNEELPFAAAQVNYRSCVAAIRRARSACVH
jgi:hypothetical protein